MSSHWPSGACVECHGVMFGEPTLSCAFVLPSGQHVRQWPGLHCVLGLTEQSAECGAGLAGRRSPTHCQERVQCHRERERGARLAAQPALAGGLPAAHHGESGWPYPKEPLHTAWSQGWALCCAVVFSSTCRTRSTGDPSMWEVQAAGWRPAGETYRKQPVTSHVRRGGRVPR